MPWVLKNSGSEKMTKSAQSRVGGHEQLISNQHLPKEIGRMQVMIDLRGIQFKNQLGPSIRLFQNYGLCAVWQKILSPASSVCILQNTSLADWIVRTETGDPARLQAQGHNKVKKCEVRKNNMLYWAASAGKSGQRSIVLVWRAQQTNQGRTPFLCSLRVPTVSTAWIGHGHPSLVSLCEQVNTRIDSTRRSYKWALSSLPLFRLWEPLNRINSSLCTRDVTKPDLDCNISKLAIL